jgi:hypothetical protein
MPDTLASMTASVQRWLRGENVPDQDIYDAVNDAIEALWMDLILASLSVMMEGPVTITLNAGDEGRILISVPDPVLSPAITSVPGGTLPAHSVYAGYTLVTESGSETNLSTMAALSIPANNLAQFGSVAFVSGAIGWNLYAGSASTQLSKQNDEPLEFGSGIWMEPSTGLLSAPDLPLPPTENTTGDNIFMLRHLEFKTSTGVYKTYNAGDLDSDLMRRFSSYVAAASEYQAYAWDLLNQRQLEIRPAAGQTFSPRYFFIVKPRRMRYGNASLPFPTIPSTEYIRSYALSLMFLTLHEYDAAAAWETKAEKALVKAVRALSQTNTNRNDHVTPFLYGGGR